MKLRGLAAVATGVVALGACSSSGSPQVSGPSTTTVAATSTATAGASLALVPTYENPDFEFDSVTSTATSYTLHFKNGNHIGFYDVAVTYGPKPKAVVTGQATDEVIANVKRSLVPVSRADAQKLVQAAPNNAGVALDTHAVASLNGGPGIEAGLSGNIAAVRYSIRVGETADGFAIRNTPDNAFVRRGPGDSLVVVYLVTSPGVTRVAISADGHVVATGAPVPAPGAPGWYLAVAGIDKHAKKLDVVPTSTRGNHPSPSLDVASQLND